MKNKIKSLAKAFGKYILPDEIVESYRNEVSLRNEEFINKSVIIITLDSCRFDAFDEAYDGQLPVKNVRKAYAPCNWTLPSHESIIRGFIPYGDFENPLEMYGYNWGRPLSLQHSYSFGVTAMAYLSSSKFISNHFHRHFIDYECENKTGSADIILSKAAKYIEGEEGFFGLINLGETHSPYKNHDSQSFQDILDGLDSGELTYEELYDMQVEQAENLLDKISDFRSEIPRGTLVIVTSDHGELFGEKGGFGHNPHERAVYCDKLLEVPLIYWTES